MRALVLLSIACVSACQSQPAPVTPAPQLSATQVAVVPSVQPADAAPSASSTHVPETAGPLSTLGESARKMAFSADGKLLRCMAAEPGIFVLDVASGAKTLSLPFPADADVIGWSADLSHVVYRASQASPLIVVNVDKQTTQALDWLQLSPDSWVAVTVSLDGRLMSVGTGDIETPLDVYDLKRKQRVFRRTLGFAPGGMNMIAVFADGKYVRTGHNRDGWLVEKLGGGARSLRLSVLSEWSLNGQWVIEVPGILLQEPLDCGPGEVPIKDGHTGRKVVSLDRKVSGEEIERSSAAFCGASAAVLGSVKAISVHRVPQGTEFQRWTTSQLAIPRGEDPGPLACSPNADHFAIGSPSVRVIPITARP